MKIPLQFNFKKKFSLSKKKILVFSFFVLILLPFFYLGFISFRFYKTVLKLKQAKEEVKTAITNQSLPQLEKALKTSQKNLEATKLAFQPFLLFKPLPLIGNYIRDGQNLLAGSLDINQAAVNLTTSLEPHADLLGLKGKGSFKGGTIQERLVLLSETLNHQSPQIKESAETFSKGTDLILTINPRRYPRKIWKWKIKNKIEKLETSLKKTNQVIKLLPGTVEMIPFLLGSQQPTHYLVLLQNDAELRPTGGFITAYARLEVKRGVVISSTSEDIYSLDRRFHSHIPAPKPIKEYLVSIPYWYLRDMNLSPDFKTSMETFYPNYLKVSQPADVVIAIDTHFLTTLINVLGEVTLPGYGTFSTKTDPNCHCPQVIYKLEKIIDQPRSTIVKNRKSILSPLMQALINKTLTAPRKRWPQLFRSLYQLGKEKNILVYSPSPQIEKIAESWNFAGRLLPCKGDYLMVVDSNMGGAKSNLYINEEVKQEYSKDQSGKVKKTITITYRNPQPWSNCNLEGGGLCLNGEYRDWLRLYVPIGSQLIKANNSLTKAISYSELGKTVFEGYVKLRPPGFYRLSFTYLLPFNWQEWQKLNYSLLIQKQAGSKPLKEELKWDSKKLNFTLNQDTKVIDFNLAN